ncbi:hypothetical protein P5X92_18335, partial [Microbacterium sp. RD12]|uniref:hypothetical protein n=2 Tax=Microbacterium TaxID=33882 RepID=UPI002468D4A0
LKSVIVPSVQSPPSMLKLHDFCNRAGTVTTAAELHRAAAAFDAASAALREAHAANGVVRWYDDPQ